MSKDQSNCLYYIEFSNMYPRCIYRYPGFVSLEFMGHPKYLTKKNGIAYHFLLAMECKNHLHSNTQLLWSKVKWEIMWKNSLLYVHDPVNQFHSEENDHHCISTYLSLSTTTLQKFSICVEINCLVKRFQNFPYLIYRKTKCLFSLFFTLCTSFFKHFSRQQFHLISWISEEWNDFISINRLGENLKQIYRQRWYK